MSTIALVLIHEMQLSLIERFHSIASKAPIVRIDPFNSYSSAVSTSLRAALYRISPELDAVVTVSSAIVMLSMSSGSSSSVIRKSVDLLCAEVGGDS